MLLSWIVPHLIGVAIVLEGVQRLGGPHLLMMKAQTKVAMANVHHHHEVFHPEVDMQIPGVHLLAVLTR